MDKRQCFDYRSITLKGFLCIYLYVFKSKDIGIKQIYLIDLIILIH